MASGIVLIQMYGLPENLVQALLCSKIAGWCKHLAIQSHLINILSKALFTLNHGNTTRLVIK